MYTARHPLALVSGLLCITTAGVVDAGVLEPSASASVPDDLSLSYQLRKDTRIGVHYGLPVGGEVRLRQYIDDQSLALATVDDFRRLRGAMRGAEGLPQTAALSLYQGLGDQWAVQLSAAWQEWSEHGSVQVDPTGSVVARRNSRDSWHLAIGTSYQASPKVQVRAGVGYDSSAVIDGKRAFASSSGGAGWRLASGVSYAYAANTELNLNYAFTWLGDMPGVDLGREIARFGATDEFANEYFHTVTFSVKWRY